MKVEDLSPALGVRVNGLELQQASEDLVGELRKLLLCHHIVVVSNQTLSEEEQQHFGQMWGELLTHPASESRPNPYVQVLASKGQGKGKHFGSWHSDMSWHPTPPRITMLHSHQLPSAGGDTGYANQHLALESLERARLDKGRSHRRHLPSFDDIASLSANHSGKQFGPNVPDSIHPVIRTHDESNQQALYVNPEFTTHLMDVDESDSIRWLFSLWLHSLNQEFCYRHKWEVGDLVIWDNRSVMHTAILDFDSPRYMTRVVVKGEQPV